MKGIREGDSPSDPEKDGSNDTAKRKQYSKMERMWGGRRDQTLFITNSHKTATKVVVGRREQEVKRRQRKTHTESLQKYAASVTAFAIQLFVRNTICHSFLISTCPFALSIKT